MFFFEKYLIINKRECQTGSKLGMKGNSLLRLTPYLGKDLSLSLRVEIYKTSWGKFVIFWSFETF